MSHVYLSRQLTPAAMAAAGSLGLPLVVHEDPDRPPSREQLLHGVRGAAALITLLTERIDEEVLDAAGSQLRIVANCAVGYDNISVPAALSRGVVVTNSPGVLDEATADCASAWSWRPRVGWSRGTGSSAAARTGSGDPSRSSAWT